MEEVLPHLWHIPVPLPDSPLRVLNSYLIQGEGESLLIDTGFRREECRQALNAALQELGVRREEVTVLLTHPHSDHAGLAPEMVGEGRKIYVSRTDISFLTDQAGTAKLRVKNFGELGFPQEELSQLQTNPAQAMAPLPCDQYAPLDEGDTLTCGGYTLEAIATPGHTPGHICYYLRREKVMLTGDHVLFDISPNITNWPNMSDALGSYLESLDKIAGFEVELALPGHRGGGDLYRRVEELKAHHAARLAETLEVVKARPESTAYDIAGRMRWKVRGKTDSWADFPLSQKWFAVGECQAHLDRLEKLGQISRTRDGNVWRYEVI
jgi:glyoxylase-like metal-dependent hydrolase (beta-lactamase superfamily II)